MEIGTGYTGTQPTGATPGSIGPTSKEEELKRKAGELRESARGRAIGLLDENKDRFAQTLERAAGAISDDRIGRYAADYARRGAEYLRSRPADEILYAARSELRRRPGLMLSACFFAGLAAARMFRGQGAR